MSGEVSILLLLGGLEAGLVLVPASVAKRYCSALGRVATGLVACQLLVALWLLPMSVCWPNWEPAMVLGNWLSFQYNATSGLMFLLISFIGWVACRYSIRYLDGEAAQGRYFQWMSFTIAAVGAMVLSADLLSFAAFWCLTSFGLHHLLVYYADRPAAQRAAWSKFVVSRIGDAAMVLAIVQFASVAPSLRFADLASAAVDSTVFASPNFQFATVCLALAVLAKSAQIPFHSWLPLTMETPTPVSALMHAGIVNAGGYLLVRSSPIVSTSVTAQTLLVIVGTLTACLGSIIMVTQTSIKKKLAYSTIAQMGFMLMQCGLGAYSAAMLHIVAHSLYKAYEFLSSGSVIARRAAMQSAPIARRPASWPIVLLTATALYAIAWLALSALGQDPLNKPAGWLLTGILCIALTSWIAHTMTVASPNILARAYATAVLLVATYALGFTLIDRLITHSPLVERAPLTLELLVACAFTGLFTFQVSLLSPKAKSRLRNWQIHAANGFYIESWLTRRAASENG